MQMLEGILGKGRRRRGKIASAALYLVSDQARLLASATTEQILNVDGGIVFC
jgi:hypothetical protein